jgi:hypothetical protein
MNAALRASLLALALGASCTWYTGPVVTVGTLQILWSFYCYDPLSGVQGATLYNVTAGTQSVTVTGYSGNQPLYQWSGNLIAYGGSFNSYRVDLSFTNPGTKNSNVTFLWSFGGANCVQAGVRSVNILVQDPLQGNVTMAVPCTQANVDGAMVLAFYAGTYPFTLSVLGGNNQPLYRALGTATVNGQSSITVHVDLQPGYPPITGQGNASVGLVFGGQSCSQANVSQILADLRDLSGTVVSKTTVSCASFSGSLSFTSISAAATYYLDAVGSTTDPDGGTDALYQLTGEGLTIQPSSTSSYNLDVPPA